VPTIQDIRLDAIEPSPLNPRRQFDEVALDELAASLRASGLINPVVVRAIGPSRFSLLAGERRWRAAHRVPWETIPAVIREADSDTEALAIMLAENLQREDLTAIEEAQTYKRLMDLGVSQVEIGRRTGRAQSTIANTLRLLQLPEPVQARVQSGALAPASARALLPLKGFPAVAEAMAERVVAQEIPVRMLERDPLATREWELQTAGVVRVLDSSTPWEWHVRCEAQCEFKAFREAGGMRGGVCLNPAHHDQLLAEAGALPEPAGTLLPIGGPRPGVLEVEERDALWVNVRRRLEGALLSDPRAVALLALEPILLAKHETLKWLTTQEPIPDPLLATLLSATPTRAGIAAALAEYPPEWVAKLALLCLLRTEAEESSHRRHPARLAEWLVDPPGDGSVGSRLQELLQPEAA
jgi:ParB/RepB/Spo0J family partition protein